MKRLIRQRLWRLLRRCSIIRKRMPGSRSVLSSAPTVVFTVHSFWRAPGLQMIRLCWMLCVPGAIVLHLQRRTNRVGSPDWFFRSLTSSRMAETRTVFVDPSQKTGAANVPPVADSHPSHDSMDEFFNQIQSEMRRSDLSQEAVSAAFQAIQQMAHEGEPEKPMAPIQAAQGTGQCASCGTENPQNSRFCNGCGSPLQTGLPENQVRVM